MQSEYFSTLKSKVKTFIDENPIVFKKIEKFDSQKIVAVASEETNSTEIMLPFDSETCSLAWKAFVAIAVVADLFQIRRAVLVDYKNQTTRKTVEEIIPICGRWYGQFKGADLGSKLGYSITNDAKGFIFGGLVFSVLGGGAMETVSRCILRCVLDYYGYDVVGKICQSCGHYFNIRIYAGHSREEVFCGKCWKRELIHMWNYCDK